jgi:hypothetical protein
MGWALYCHYCCLPEVSETLALPVVEATEPCSHLGAQLLDVQGQEMDQWFAQVGGITRAFDGGGCTVVFAAWYF